MLSVTVRSCIEELRAIGGGEIVICDNSDRPAYDLINSVLPTGYCREGIIKIIRQDFPCLFTARETAIRESKSDLVLCLDSHMIVSRDGIKTLVEFMEGRRDDHTLGFAHAPLSWCHQHESVAKHDRDMSRSELGPWGVAYKVERPITWKGMPWICRKDWFLDYNKGLGGYGALSENRISWGGGDMHIGVKPWLLGFKNWAVPGNPFIHIGPFPKIDISPDSPDAVIAAKTLKDQTRYRLYTTSGEFPHAFGFIVSCYVLGGEAMMLRNEKMLNERFGKFIDVRKWWDKAIQLGAKEKSWLDSHKIMDFETLLKLQPWNKFN